MNAVIFIGLQASGKTTFFLERFVETHLCLSMDMLKTRYRETILLKACIQSKQAVVLDNTNPTIIERKKYIDEFRDGKFEVIGYYFKSNIEDCLIRNSNRINKIIPEIGLKSTHKKLELPSFDEGFDKLYYVSIENNKFEIQEWENEI